MEVNELLIEAERTLREADPLCVDANAFYAELRLLIEQATILWARILFLHAAQQDQLQNIGTICLVIRSGVEKAQSECKSKLKCMRRNRTGLHSLLGTLKQTSVDEAFMGQPTLYQYVHDSDISNLESQADVLTEQLQKIAAEIDGLPDLIQQQLAELRSRSPELPPLINSAVPSKMVKMTQKAAPYASDMADLLSALTSHYDLCCQIPQLRREEAAEAISVAKGDRKEVSNALSRLKECRNQLRHKHRESQRLQHSLAMSFENLKSFEDDVSAFIGERLRPALVEVSEKHAQCLQLYSSVDAITNELTGLTEYYRLFKKSYHALVVEVARRTESSKQLRKIVENANNALKGFQVREADARQAFTDTYQEFLPNEIWPNMSDMPKHYAVTLEPEELPELSQSSLIGALHETDQ